MQKNTEKLQLIKKNWKSIQSDKAYKLYDKNEPSGSNQLLIYIHFSSFV